ncbi:MAG: hypothetical protein PWP08_782 [Methanofollis sp.]|nr:hypothetical protein [Methanofollis sp.]
MVSGKASVLLLIGLCVLAMPGAAGTSASGDHETDLDLPVIADDDTANANAANFAAGLISTGGNDRNIPAFSGSGASRHFTLAGNPVVSYGAIPLYPGWNFVSTPKALAAGNNTAAIFAGVDTAGHSLLRYDAPSQTWVALKAADTIRPLEGYWVYVAEGTDVPLDYAGASPQAPPSRTLAAGWNAVGFSDTEPATARDTLLSLKDTWSVLMGYNASARAYETAIVRNGSGEHSDAGVMMPMKGYWLYMTDDGTLAAIGA